MAQLFADEDFPFFVERLRELGHDVLTTPEAGRANQGSDDPDQLAFATSVGRTILTRNRRHFAPLHRSSAGHSGIISITDDSDFRGQADRIHRAIVSCPDLSSQHIRVNRPSKPAKP